MTTPHSDVPSTTIPTDAAPADDSSKDRGYRLRRAVQVLGRAMNAAGEPSGGMTVGELAMLRRLDPEVAGDAAFYRRMAWLEVEQAVSLSPDAEDRDDDERRWACVLQGMALCAGMHRSGIPAGASLARTISEARFVALLKAHGVQLRMRVRTTARQLASASEPVDWTDLARLVLSDGQSWEDAVRRDVARTYFAELDRRERGSAAPSDDD